MARDGVRAGKHPFPGRFRLLRASLKLIRAQTDKVKFDPAGIENPVNMLQQPLVVRVIFVVQNRNNVWTQELLKAYDLFHWCVF